MATAVKDIVDNSRTLAATVITSPTWRILRFVNELQRNSGRDAAKAYNCRPLEAYTVETQTNVETLEQRFEFVISDLLARQDDDSEIEAVNDVLYDKLDQIFKLFVTQKINLAGTVVLVHDRSMDAPIFENGNVFIRMSFLVRYRQSLL